MQFVFRFIIIRKHLLSKVVHHNFFIQYSIFTICFFEIELIGDRYKLKSLLLMSICHYFFLNVHKIYIKNIYFGSRKKIFSDYTVTYQRIHKGGFQLLLSLTLNNINIIILKIIIIACFIDLRSENLIIFFKTSTNRHLYMCVLIIAM